MLAKGLDVKEPDDSQGSPGKALVHVVDECPGILWAAVLKSEVEAAETGEPFEVRRFEAGRPGPADDEELRRLREPLEQAKLHGAVGGHVEGAVRAGRSNGDVRCEERGGRDHERRRAGQRREPRGRAPARMPTRIVARRAGQGPPEPRTMS